MISPAVSYIQFIIANNLSKSEIYSSNERGQDVYKSKVKYKPAIFRNVQIPRVHTCMTLAVLMFPQSQNFFKVCTCRDASLSAVCLNSRLRGAIRQAESRVSFTTRGGKDREKHVRKIKYTKYICIM